MRVALIAAHEGTDHLRGQQPDLVAESQQPARPVLRAAARLHRDQARRAIDEVFQELRPATAASPQSRPSPYRPSTVETPSSAVSTPTTVLLHFISDPPVCLGRSHIFPSGHFRCRRPARVHLIPPALRHQSPGGVHSILHEGLHRRRLHIGWSAVGSARS